MRTQCVFLLVKPLIDQNTVDIFNQIIQLVCWKCSGFSAPPSEINQMNSASRAVCLRGFVCKPNIQ